jgi:hypothetical protein
MVTAVVTAVRLGRGVAARLPNYLLTKSGNMFRRKQP